LYDEWGLGLFLFPVCKGSKKKENLRKIKGKPCEKGNNFVGFATVSLDGARMNE